MFFSIDTKRKICVCKTSIYSLGDLSFQVRKTLTNEMAREGEQVYTPESLTEDMAWRGAWGMAFPPEG